MLFTDLACCGGCLSAVGVRKNILALKWDRAYADKAYPDGVYTDGVYIDGAYINRAYTNRA